MQLLINIIYTASIFLLISISFSITYSISKFFNIAHAFLITAGAYITYFFMSLNYGFILSSGISIIICIVFQYLIFKTVFSILLKRNSDSFFFLASSLGLYIIFQNVISILFGVNKKVIHIFEIKEGLNIIGGYITESQLLTIIICLSLYILFYFFINRTDLGLKIRGISSNIEFSITLGINSKKIVIIAFLVGAALACISGILIAINTSLSPSMGFNYFLYGIVCMIIGGVGNYRGIVLGAILLSTTQHLGAYMFDSKWMDLIAYIILIIFLIWKPLGFSGKQLKKVEI